MGADETDAEAIAASLTTPARFEPVFRRHYQPVRAYLQRRVGPDLGEELAAQTFVRAFERRATYDMRYASARPWLFAIATNLLRHHVRDERRHLLRLASALPSEQVLDDEEERLESLAVRPALLGALASIPKVERDTLLLAVHAGLTYEEIARAAGVPLGTVRSRIHRAKRRLREQLAQLGDMEEESRSASSEED